MKARETDLVDNSVSDLLDLLEKLGIKSANDKHMESISQEARPDRGYIDGYVDRNLKDYEA